MSKAEKEYVERLDRQFRRQSIWTKGFRNQIYREIGLKNARRILEVGCGTGIISKELREKTSAQITAIDRDRLLIAHAQENIDEVEFYRMSVEELSFRDETFDVVICNYFFLWLDEPFKALIEMIRVCKVGGYVVALGEPDYGGWLEYPELELGKKHYSSLKKQGANPEIGRILLPLFESTNLNTKVNVIAQIWSKEELKEQIENEWKLVLEAEEITQEEYEEKIKKEFKAIDDNMRLIFLPLFTAIGKKEKKLEPDEKMIIEE